MSYLLVVAEVRRGVFEERNLDSIGLGSGGGSQDATDEDNLTAQSRRQGGLGGL